MLRLSEHTRRWAMSCGVVLALSWGTAAGAFAAEAARKGESHIPPELRPKVYQAIRKGLAYLAASQRPDGSWPLRGQSDPAITAIVVKCFVQDPHYGPKHPLVRRALEFVLRYRQPDGGIYVPGYGLRNYYTSVCLMALAATHDPEMQPYIRAAQNFLKKLQWDEGENIEPDNPWYGGTGYGKHKRPDLSNTQMMLEALRQSGLPPTDPVYQKALKFITRYQMNSATNDQPFARGATDGGFIYTCANGGESKAGVVMVKGRPMLRSYGSMTYAGFKSMLYANVSRDDPRVRKALEWIRRYYTLDSNPNMPGAQSLQGLFYYYHVFAKAFAAWGEPTIRDVKGVVHNWRAELCAKLLSLQREDGSWVNKADRWEEGNPYYVTALAILCLQTALQ